MRDLAAIIKRNKRKGVGEKLGEDNGKPPFARLEPGARALKEYVCPHESTYAIQGSTICNDCGTTL